MNRLVLPLLAGAGALALAACGSAAAGTTTPKPGASPTPRNGARAFNGAFGQLVQIKGQTLIVSNAQGDTTVTYTSSTPITQTSTATFADIATGECLTATGTKDAGGAVTASNVTVRNAVNGSCSAAAIFGPGGPGGAGNGGATRTPNPNRTPNPSFSPPANLGRASGLVTAVNGTSVTVQDTTSTGTTTSTITVPTTVRVSRIDTVDTSALQTGECLTAAGQKDSSGTVQARALTIVPAGPNGCTAGGGGFFGGGRFGGGGGFPGGGGSGTGGTAA